MNTTSVSLLQQLRKSDNPRAWDRFVQLYTPLLCQWARRAGLREQDVEDLVQDVFTTLLQKLPAFAYNPQQRFRAWLRAVAMNRWVDLQRRRKLGPVQAPEAALEEAAVADNTADWGEDEDRQQLTGRALRLIQAEFQPSTWKACWEVVVAGRPGAEVAAELGLSVGVVYIAKSRVLRRLREEFDGMLE